LTQAIFQRGKLFPKAASKGFGSASPEINPLEISQTIAPLSPATFTFFNHCIFIIVIDYFTGCDERLDEKQRDTRQPCCCRYSLTANENCYIREMINRTVFQIQSANCRLVLFGGYLTLIRNGTQKLNN